MCSPVYHQFTGRLEGFVAGLTRIWAFPAMGSLVIRPGAGRLEGFVAGLTLIWAYPCMCSLVYRQVTRL